MDTLRSGRPQAFAPVDGVAVCAGEPDVADAAGVEGAEGVEGEAEVEVEVELDAAGLTGAPDGEEPAPAGLPPG
ncbi:MULTISPECIES: hypothetical protein [Streptomyces]|uniref:hypothetical protein n=1 Tax=Streptomyces TaxID=1883 RepID=UPI0029C9D558|nr:hypothetical protein [Streptomyces sp. AK02-04a]